MVPVVMNQQPRQVTFRKVHSVGCQHVSFPQQLMWARGPLKQPFLENDKSVDPEELVLTKFSFPTLKVSACLGTVLRSAVGLISITAEPLPELPGCTTCPVSSSETVCNSTCYDLFQSSEGKLCKSLDSSMLLSDSIINYAYVWSKCDACAPPYASCTKLRTSSNNVYRPMLNTWRPWLVQDQNATGQFDNCTAKLCKEVQVVGQMTVGLGLHSHPCAHRLHPRVENKLHLKIQ